MGPAQLPGHFSYSSWMLARKGCRWRWKLDYVDKVRARDAGIHMDFGTACHAAAEAYKPRGASSGCSVDVAVEIFCLKFDELRLSNAGLYRPNEYTKAAQAFLPRQEKSSKEEVDRAVDDEAIRERCANFFKEAGENIVRAFDSCPELRDLEVLFNEHQLYEKIERSDGLSVFFKGFIDITGKSKDGRGKPVVLVGDFKTCGWGWDAKKQSDRDTHYQVFLYKHFLAKETGIDPKLIRTGFFLLKKRPRPGSPTVEFFPVSAGPVSVQRALDELDADISSLRRQLESGTIPKDRDQCVNKFEDICPYLGTEHCTGTPPELADAAQANLVKLGLKKPATQDLSMEPLREEEDDPLPV